MGAWGHPASQQYSQDLPFVPPYPGGPHQGYAYGGGPSEQPPEYAGGDAPVEKEKGDLGLNKADFAEHNDSTATLHPVSLHDPPAPSSPTGPGAVEGRV